MKFAKTLAATIMGVAMMAGSATAHAAEYIMTFRGTFETQNFFSGLPSTPVFGATSGSQLNGQNYEAVFRLNHPHPGATVQPDFLGGEQTWTGSAFGIPTMLSGSFTLNGVTLNTNSQYLGIVEKNITRPGAHRELFRINSQQQNPSDHRSGYQLIILDGFLTNQDIFDSLDIGETAEWSLAVGDRSPGTMMAFDDRATSALVNGSLRTNFFRIELANTNGVPGVPEPATWAMMIIGFGAVGGAMRRKRNTPALA